MRDRLRIPSPAELLSVFLYRPRFVWGGLFVPSFIIVECVAIAANNGHPPGIALNIAGYLIGLAGLLLVAFGLARTRRLFGKPSAFSRLVGWARAMRGLFVRRTATVFADSVSEWAVVSDEPSVTVTVGQLSVEERIAILERRADATDRRIAEVQAEAHREVERTRAELRADHGHLQQRVGTLGKQLEELGVGGLDLEGMGLFWLIVGSIISTLHEQIAALDIWRLFG